MKKVIISCFVLCAMTSLQANAFDFNSVLNFLSKTAETQTAEVQTVKSFEDIKTQMTAIDSSVQEAFINIVSELSTRKETKNIKNELKSDSAALSNLISNYTATLANNKDKMVKTVSKLSSKEKTALLNNLATLATDSQQYMTLATDGARTATNAIKTAQKLNEFATAVSNINTVAAELKNRATTVVNFTNQVKTIAAAAGMSVK